MFGLCPLCQRKTALTFHHLIPKKCHKRNYFRKRYSRTQLQEGIYICRSCHNGIHRHHTEMELGKAFNRLESLKNDEKIMRHCRWVSKQKIS